MRLAAPFIPPTMLRFAVAFGLSAVGASGQVPEPEPHHSIALSPADSIATMQLQPGYAIEPVLTEPYVEEPVMIAFDGNGRMFVAEMRTYMLDADGTGEFEPTSRISLHEDTDGDGIYDRHSIFADGLLLPRILLPLDDRVIIGETNTDDLYVYRDTDGDGVADEKSLWFEGGPRGGNMEHQPNGLVWALDNHLYATYYDYRLSVAPDGSAVKQEIPANGGQWGLTQDDWGKVWFVNAGGEHGPVHFQQHILYGKIDAPGQYDEGYKTVWPIDNVPDTQGGRPQLRDDNTLNHFTATCGQDIFRGDRLPSDLRGDLLFAEPVGRLIRRTTIRVEDGITKLANTYEAARSEFLRATDPLFRPVNMVTAPDGTLYVIDMYRGIIQESNWTKEDTYLREQILKLGLDHEIGLGRIYRITHRDFTPGPQPRMLDESPAELVAHLSHPNGWWRDTAQKLIVLHRDLSVVPALEELARHPGSDPRPRLHALWTLDGLGALDPSLILTALQDDDPQVRHTGLRLVEPLIGPETPAASAYVVAAQARLRDPDPTVAIQAMLSLHRADRTDAKAVIQAAAETAPSAGVYLVNEQLWAAANTEDPFLLPLLGPAGLKAYRSGRTLYETLCFACHGTDGRGMPATEDRTIAPALAGSARILGDPSAAIAVVLSGLQGPVDGTDYGAPMVPMSSYSDDQLANVLTYIRNSFGNRGTPVAASAVATRRALDATRSGFWTPGELAQTFPALLVPRRPFVHREAWLLTAFEPALDGTALAFAVDDDLTTGYSTALSTPYPDQWVQIELPAVSMVTGVEFLASDDNKKTFPPAFAITVSTDGETWSAPIAEGPGERHLRVHLAAPVSARFIRVTLTEKTGWQRWVVNDIQLYGDER